MASTTRSSNGRSTESSRSSGSNASGSRSRTTKNARSRSSGNNRSSRSSADGGSAKTAKREITKATSTVGSAAKKAKTPLVAGGAAAAGLATGTALGALLRGSRRPRVLGLPMPRGDEMKAGAHKAVRAGRWLYDMESDLRLLREQAERSRHQSPIEVLLSGLTSRRLPRRT
jgi:hypothetical protein